MIKRRRSRIIKIGRVPIGGNKPIAVQSMTKTHTRDVSGTLRQIKELEASGCEIVRLSVADLEDAAAIKKIKPFSRLPLVADIHFDFRLALAAIDNGIDKVRLNPGNIYKREEVREVARAAKAARIPIRVGVNSGSLKGYRRLPAGRRQDISSSMVKSAMGYIKMLEGFGFFDIVVSLKASDIFDTIEAYRKMAAVCDYPFHLGVTATGLAAQGIIKSAISIGVLLSRGIGDTIRVSLTGSPQEEVKASRAILQAMGLRNFAPEIISCPTCGRCQVDLIKIVKDLEVKLSTSSYGGDQPTTLPQKVAVMGCMVNGPGEARAADIGIAFGKKEGLLFKKGRPVRKIAANECVRQLLKTIKNINH